MQKKCVDKDFYTQFFLIIALFDFPISTYGLTMGRSFKNVLCTDFSQALKPVTLGRESRYNYTGSSYPGIRVLILNLVVGIYTDLTGFLSRVTTPTELLVIFYFTQAIKEGT